ncbi:LysR family transcriptional regulator [Pelosinus sp. UFO1]|uniref:LysR family transcriptional regulator n=1 Tax=Pelosinus sp. UFO1 TaxID=484770 RepID=UPI0004D1D62F|nr:LysR family transcriptional regulator [Pelosinus sp. UFO1]AIF49928.1 transcriptional regulator, LysR family [Pelosinus sp. UFO1]
MDIKNLECFIEVARYKSFSKAAEMMYISQPSISRMIKELETQFGVMLCYRDTKSVRLTDAGEIILRQAQQIVSSFQSITAQLGDLKKMQTGKIHIGIPQITAITSFSNLLSAFKNEYPNISIHLYEVGPKKVEAAIQEGSLDIGIFTPSEDDDLYEKIWFEQDPLEVIMHPTSRLAQYKVIDYKMLIDEEFVLYSNDYKLHDMIIDECKHAGFKPKIVLETSQRDWMTQMVAGNLGIAMLPSKICKSFDNKVIIHRPLEEPKLYLRLALVWRKERYLSYAALEFLSFVKNQLAKSE